VKLGHVDTIQKCGIFVALVTEVEVQHRVVFATAISAFLLGCVDVSAADCKVELFKTFLSSESDYKNDFRFLKHVTDEQREAASKNSEGGGEVFGFGSADYSSNSFKEKSRLISDTTDIQSSTQQYENVLWTGLDDSGAKAYSECIRGSNFGLFLTPGKSSKTQQVFHLYYKSPDGQPQNLVWQGQIPSKDQLPVKIKNGQEIPIVLPRPSQGEEYFFAATAGIAASDTVFLAYLPPPVISPEWKTLNTVFDGKAKYSVDKEVFFRDITYRNIDPKSPHRHEFRFFISVSNNSEPYVSFFENDKDWRIQTQTAQIGGKIVEFAFHHFDNGAGKLNVRVWP
jgi:hypothetical protein